MAIKAVCVDDHDTMHLLLGVNRKEVESLLRGDRFTFPPGGVSLSSASKITLFFAETDDELEKHLPPPVAPAAN
jgi:hypothetical protein